MHIKPVVPAIIPQSLEAAVFDIGRLEFSRELHLDVVDGLFVPFTSWPYRPKGDPQLISIWTDMFTLEVDLMVQDPLMAAQAWVAAGADMLVFHAETISPEAFKKFAQHTTISIGIAANNDLPLDQLAPYVADADYVQVMGIAKIGAQGLPLDERVFERIAFFREHYPAHLLSVDGSVNPSTIKVLSEAGAGRFICGSAIIGTDDPEQAYRNLSAQL